MDATTVERTRLAVLLVTLALLAALLTVLVVGSSSEDQFWGYVVAHVPSDVKLGPGAREQALKAAHQICDEIPDSNGRRQALRNVRALLRRKPEPTPGKNAPLGQQITHDLVEGILGTAGGYFGVVGLATFTYLCPP